MSTQNNNNKNAKHFLDAIEEGDTTNEDSLSIADQIKQDTNTVSEDLEENVITEEEQVFESEDDFIQDNENIEEDAEVEEFSYAPFAQELIDSDVIIIPEEGKQYDDNIDGFKEMIDDTVRFKIDEYKASFNNPTTSKFIEFLENGGSPDEFIDRSSELPDYANLDVTDIETQKNLIRDSLTLQGYDDDDIEHTVNSFEEINTLEKNAKVAQKKLVEYADKKLAQITNEQKEKEQKRFDSLNSELVTLKKTIFEASDIAGFKPTKTEREKFYEYMTKPVKDLKGNNTTKYLLDMQEEDKVKMAYYKFKNFSFSDIEAKVETKKANDLQKVLKLKGDKISGKNSTVPEDEIVTNKLPHIPWLSL